ncbi:hypothetical protein DENSPDRAFT_58467 [Dentipellis sp. KUC8613]|nr:hypothetical protein DENSPDRAFT_58467 [Dentipellis sp. KUC8613]
MLPRAGESILQQKLLVTLRNDGLVIILPSPRSCYRVEEVRSPEALPKFRSNHPYRHNMAPAPVGVDSTGRHEGMIDLLPFFFAIGAGGRKPAEICRTRIALRLWARFSYKFCFYFSLAVLFLQHLLHHIGRATSTSTCPREIVSWIEVEARGRLGLDHD